tara:strand:- start:2405 stop:2956 length:552 start_codon:yes stop_codon:yes gene_type:complete
MLIIKTHEEFSQTPLAPSLQIESTEDFNLEALKLYNAFIFKSSSQNNDNNSLEKNIKTNEIFTNNEECPPGLKIFTDNLTDIAKETIACGTACVNDFGAYTENDECLKCFDKVDRVFCRDVCAPDVEWNEWEPDFRPPGTDDCWKCYEQRAENTGDAVVNLANDVGNVGRNVINDVGNLTGWW